MDWMRLHIGITNQATRFTIFFCTQINDWLVEQEANCPDPVQCKMYNLGMSYEGRGIYIFHGSNCRAWWIVASSVVRYCPASPSCVDLFIFLGWLTLWSRWFSFGQRGTRKIDLLISWHLLTFHLYNSPCTQQPVSGLIRTWYLNIEI